MAPAALASSQLVVLITFWYYKYFPPSWWVGKHTHTMGRDTLYLLVSSMLNYQRQSHVSGGRQRNVWIF